jgi:hypothetical protein
MNKETRAEVELMNGRTFIASVVTMWNGRWLRIRGEEAEPYEVEYIPTFRVKCVRAETGKTEDLAHGPPT